MSNQHPSAQTEQAAQNTNTFRNAFGVVNVTDSRGIHGIGMDTEATVTIARGPRYVPDTTDGPKLLVMRVYQNDGQIVGFLNYEGERVEQVIADLRTQLETLVDDDVVADLENGFEYYAGNVEYPNERAHIGIYCFQQQMNVGKNTLQAVSRLGTGIDGRPGIPIFGKKGIPLPEDEQKIWRMASVFVKDHGGMAVAVGESDKDRIIAAIRSLERQLKAIDEMNSLPPPNGEAKEAARQLKSSIRLG